MKSVFYAVPSKALQVREEMWGILTYWALAAEGQEGYVRKGGPGLLMKTVLPLLTLLDDNLPMNVYHQLTHYDSPMCAPLPLLRSPSPAGPLILSLQSPIEFVFFCLHGYHYNSVGCPTCNSLYLSKRT